MRKHTCPACNRRTLGLGNVDVGDSVSACVRCKGRGCRYALLPGYSPE